MRFQDGRTGLVIPQLSHPSRFLKAGRAGFLSSRIRHTRLPRDWSSDVCSSDLVAMHQVVANQLLADDPPETWQTVQRLAGRGYDWHNIMHMIAALVTEDVYGVLKENRQPDPAAYVRRLTELPGDWPPPKPVR